ncbi:hypothetical protein A2U01_0111151, partial [Trifolium medium]|nr:hypothetical protein [Trifolium medium]
GKYSPIPEALLRKMSQVFLSTANQPPDSAKNLNETAQKGVNTTNLGQNSEAIRMDICAVTNTQPSSR